jgi:hypothetical protein
MGYATVIFHSLGPFFQQESPARPHKFVRDEKMIRQNLLNLHSIYGVESYILCVSKVLQILGATKNLLFWRGKMWSKVGFAYCVDNRYLDRSV